MSKDGLLSHNQLPTTLVPSSAAPIVRNQEVLTASALSTSHPPCVPHYISLLLRRRRRATHFSVASKVDLPRPPQKMTKEVAIGWLTSRKLGGNLVKIFKALVRLTQMTTSTDPRNIKRGECPGTRSLLSHFNFHM